jgi:hypothetical protein
VKSIAVLGLCKITEIDLRSLNDPSAAGGDAGRDRGSRPWRSCKLVAAQTTPSFLRDFA